MNELPRISRIVAATDLDDCSTRALEHAKALGRRFGAEIVMLHSVPAHATVEPLPAVLDEYRAKHLPASGGPAPVLEAGDPSVAILATSRSREADLVVMGTHGRRGLTRALLGSVAEQVIAESDIPVLTVRCAERPRNPRFARILCPVNYTETAAKALRHATLLASAFEAELIILNLIEDEGAEEIEREVERLRAWIGDVSMPVRARVLVQRGQAAGQAIDFAQRHDVDLLVIGAQRKGAGARTVLGSTTYRLTRHAPCPVLTVPAESFPADLHAA